MTIFPVHVTNISREASSADLRAAFSDAGAVLEVVIFAEHGFVTYGSAEEAVRAVERIDRFRVGGQALRVDYSEELEEYLRRRRGRGRRTSPSPQRQTRRSRSPNRRMRSPVRGRNRFGAVSVQTGAKNWNRRRRSRSRSPPRRQRTPSPPVRRRSRSPTPPPPPPPVPADIEESGDGDLREILNRRKRQRSGEHPEHDERGEQAGFDDIKISADGQSRRAVVKDDLSTGESKYFKFLVGNLMRRVETADVFRLLQAYGGVIRVDLRESHAFVEVDCDQDAADRAVAELDQSLWMDNNIIVKQIYIPKAKPLPDEQAKNAVEPTEKDNAEESNAMPESSTVRRT